MRAFQLVVWMEIERVVQWVDLSVVWKALKKEDSLVESWDVVMAAHSVVPTVPQWGAYWVEKTVENWAVKKDAKLAVPRDIQSVDQ